jgi:hypothetical protein
MPKRTNSFQRLVHLLQLQLADSGAAVTESKELPDRVDGQLVEVDVAVEMVLGGYALTVGIEARGGRRKVERNGAFAVIGKYKRVVDKTVIVARGGFTRGALKLCKEHGVEPITLSEAVAADWDQFFHSFKDLTFGLFDLAVASGPTIRWSKRSGQPDKPLTAEPRPKLVGAGGELFEFDEINKQAMHYVTKGAYVSKSIMEEWYRRPSAERRREYQVTIDITPESSTPIVLEQEGLFYRLDQLSYQVHVNVRTSPLSMSAMSFNQRRVLQGNTRLEGGRTVELVLTEDRVGGAKATLRVGPSQPSESATIHTVNLSRTAEILTSG